MRGLGVFWAIELVADRTTKTPLDAAAMGKVIAACKDRGVWPFAPANRIHVVPPLTISDDELREGLAVIDEALTVADNLVNPRTVCFKRSGAASTQTERGFGQVRRRPLRG